MSKQLGKDSNIICRIFSHSQIQYFCDYLYFSKLNNTTPQLLFYKKMYGDIQNRLLIILTCNARGRVVDYYVIH